MLFDVFGSGWLQRIADGSIGQSYEFEFQQYLW